MSEREWLRPSGYPEDREPRGAWTHRMSEPGRTMTKADAVVAAAVRYVEKGPRSPGAWTALFDAVKAYEAEVDPPNE